MRLFVPKNNERRITKKKKEKKEKNDEEIGRGPNSRSPPCFWI